MISICETNGGDAVYNKKIKIVYLLSLFFLLNGCSDNNKEYYGYWSGVSDDGNGSFDLFIDKDSVYSLEEDGVSEYSYVNVKEEGLEGISIPKKEFNSDLDGSVEGDQARVLITPNYNYSENPRLQMIISSDKLISATLYPVEEVESNLYGYNLGEELDLKLPILVVCAIIIGVYLKKSKNKKV